MDVVDTTTWISTSRMDQVSIRGPGIDVRGVCALDDGGLPSALQEQEVVSAKKYCPCAIADFETNVYATAPLV